MYNRATNEMINWKNQPQQRNTVFDQHVAQDKKDRKLPPSHYFPSSKGLAVSIRQVNSDAMFSTKKYEVSKLPVKGFTFIDVV